MSLILQMKAAQNQYPVDLQDNNDPPSSSSNWWKIGLPILLLLVVVAYFIFDKKDAPKDSANSSISSTTEQAQSQTIPGSTPKSETTLDNQSESSSNSSSDTIQEPASAPTPPPNNYAAPIAALGPTDFETSSQLESLIGTITRNAEDELQLDQPESDAQFPLETQTIEFKGVAPGTGKMKGSFRLLDNKGRIKLEKAIEASGNFNFNFSIKIQRGGLYYYTIRFQNGKTLVGKFTVGKI